MNTPKNTTLNRKEHTRSASRSGRVVASEMTIWMCALAIVVTSAIWTKERGTLPALAQVKQIPALNQVSTQTQSQTQSVIDQTIIDEESIASAIESASILEQTTEAVSTETQIIEAEPVDTSIRWFDGKAVRPVRVIYMTVTGYSPDARSCGIYADGKTATMHSVWTNGMNLVAADPRVLPYWSMISVPGYAGDDIVPVLDCGGAIKGSRLDLLYPTHELALIWGVRQLPVTVWEYVDSE